MRYWLMGLLFVVSTIPQFVLLPIFGGINLLLLVVVWVILCAFILLAPKPLAAFVAVLGSVMMAIPPVPNYVFPTNSGTLHFQFIGWKNVEHALYSVVFFFVFYLVIFELAVFLTRKSTPTLRKKRERGREEIESIP